MSTAHAQPGGKRQKVRDGRAENVDYFQGIEKLEYNNLAPASNSASFRHYSGSARLHSRSMDDWIKCSISFTEFRSSAADPRWSGSASTRPWDDNTNSLDNYKRCIKAFFDFCTKLGIKQWTAFDTDLVPAADTWEEGKANWDDVVEYVQELSQRFHMKLLWLAPDLHSHPRYASGALTSNDVTALTHAASQIKKCLDVSQRLNAECFLIHPHKEGYDVILQTDVTRELKLFAKLLKITAEYKDKLNYRCQLLIMPYYSCNSCDYENYRCNSSVNSWRGDLVGRYMWDVTSCLYFLKCYNLDRHYKVCTPPGHHMYMANVYNMLGGVAITNDVDHCDSKKLTLMIKSIVDQGATPPGGVNLRLRPRRGGDLRELVTCYAKYIDAIAKALRVACSLAAEQIFSKHVQQRYATYCSGFGSRLTTTDVSIEECEDYCKKNQTYCEAGSKREHLQVVFHRYLDACDHV